jgi:hypothetical protein
MGFNEAPKILPRTLVNTNLHEANSFTTQIEILQVLTLDSIIMLNSAYPNVLLPRIGNFMETLLRHGVR